MTNQGRNNGGWNGYDPGGDLDDTRVFDNSSLRDQGRQPYGGQWDDYDQGYGQDYDQGYGYDQNYSYDQGYGQNYDPGYPGYEQEPYYDQGDYDYEPEYEGRMTMAARAAGKRNPDPYSRSRRSSSAREAHQQAQRQPRRTDSGDRGYDYDYAPPARKRRRKKRHGFRNFLIFLLILAALAGVVYFLLFRAPDRYEAAGYNRKPGFYNILLCALDESELRTDTMMMATLDGKNGTVSLTTLPRDTIVDNGEWVPKLNGVYGLAGGGAAGAEAIMDALQPILGFRPDGYAIINYEVFRDAVDALGGVTFDVPMDMTVGDETFYAGEQVLNGEQALAVCRFRYGYLMADIQRQYVQQNFVKAMIRECMSPGNWGKLPRVYEAVMANTVTDLSGANIRYLALHAYLAGLGDIQQYSLPGEGVDYNGASCFGLYGQSVVDLVNQVMNPFREDITIDDVYILTVEDGWLVESTQSGDAFDPSTYDYSTYSDE